MITSLLQHIGESILFLVILMSPVPLCLWFSSVNQNGKYQFSLAHHLLSSLTLWCSIQVFIALVLGSIHQFFLPSVIGLELGILLIGITCLNIRKSSLLTLVINLFKFSNRFSEPEILVITSGLLAGAILLNNIATQVIIDYDSLWYHLPTMARWYQEGKFIRLDEFATTHDWITDAITYYPYNWEILCTVFVMPFREDFLVALPNLISSVILGVSIYLLSLSIGAKRFYGMAAASLVLTMPLIIQHVNSLHIDLPFSAFFMASLYFAVSYNKSRSFIDLSSFFLAIGMLLGIKMSSVGYAILPILSFLILEIKSFISHEASLGDVFRQSKLAIPTLALSVFGFLFLGGYWYFKNLINVGNPLGDLQVKIANVLLFPGTMKLATLRQTSLANLYNFTDFSHWKILGVQAIVRLQLPFLVLLLQVLLLPRLFLTKPRVVYNRFLLGVCLFVLLGTGYLYWTTPFTGTLYLPPQPINQYIGQQIRFAIPFLSMLGVIAAVVASSVRTPNSMIAIFVLVSSLLGIISSTVFDIIRTSTAFKGGVGWASSILDGFRTDPGASTAQLFKLVGNSLFEPAIYVLIYVIVFILLVWGAYRESFLKMLATKAMQISRRVGRFASIFILIGLLLMTSWSARGKRDIARKEVYGGVYEYIATNLNPNQTLGYLLSYRSYFFYGKHWNQKVLYIPSKSENLSHWVDDLKQRQISVIAVGPLEEKMGWQPPEVLLLESSDQPFTPVFGQDPKKGVTIYRLQSGKRL